MSHPIITLTTDFGQGSTYVAAMKGVILRHNPQVHIVDLTHDIPPQDIHHAAFFLAATIPFFPEEVIHVAVVDPGVGTTRALLYLEIDGHRLLAPDNGCCSRLIEPGQAPSRVICLESQKYWRSNPSATFHGRDILAPVAAHLSLGLDPTRLGPKAASFERLAIPTPTERAGQIEGEVIYIDRFGNLITNIPATSVERFGPRSCVQVASRLVGRIVSTYGDAAAGECVALVSSFGLLEVAVAGGSAAELLGLRRGAKVIMSTHV